MGDKESAGECEFFGGHAAGRPAVWTRSTSLCGSVVLLLGQPPLPARGAVSFADCGLDTCLHRALFLASAKAVFQMGRAIFAGNRRAAPAPCNDRHPSRRPRSDPTSITTAMACRTHK